MANIFEERLAEAKQKRDMARLLRQQYDNQPSGQMVSGWYVPNTGNAILGALANVIGGYQESEANKEAKGIERERSQALAQALGSAGIAPPQTLLQQAGTPEEKPGFLDRTVSFLRGEQAPVKPAQPYQVNVAQNVTPEQRDAALMSLYQIDPTMAAPMVAHEQFKLQKEQAADLKREALQARREELQQQIQARQDIADENNQLRLQLAQIAAGNKQPQSQFEYKEINGQPFSFNRFTNQLMPVQAPETAGFSPKKLTPEQQKIQDATDAIDILKQAAPLIKQSTSSGLGAGVDYAAGLIGKSTEGADAAAQLKVLGGALVSKMPKMSGPQSDKDVLLYKEMAGRIGDPTVPQSQKIAAMNSINELQARYAGIKPIELNFDKPTPADVWSIKPLDK